MLLLLRLIGLIMMIHFGRLFELDITKVILFGIGLIIFSLGVN